MLEAAQGSGVARVKQSTRSCASECGCQLTCPQHRRRHMGLSTCTETLRLVPLLHSSQDSGMGWGVEGGSVPPVLGPSRELRGCAGSRTPAIPEHTGALCMGGEGGGCPHFTDRRTEAGRAIPPAQGPEQNQEVTTGPTPSHALGGAGGC